MFIANINITELGKVSVYGRIGDLGYITANINITEQNSG